MIDKSKNKIYSTILTVMVMTLCPAIIISLMLYADNRTDHFYDNVNRVRILADSWHGLERETANLLTEPATNSDEKKWLYSIRIFDAMLKTFQNTSQTKELAAENEIFRDKIERADDFWLKLKSKIDPSIAYLTGCIKSGCKTNFEPYVTGQEQETGLLYSVGYLSGADSLQISPKDRFQLLTGKPASEFPDTSYRRELIQLTEDCRYILAVSRTHYTALIEEMMELVSSRAAEKAIKTRLTAFALSITMVVVMLFFLARTQRKYHLNQIVLEKLLHHHKKELESAISKVEAAEQQREEMNSQLQTSVGHANLMTQRAMEANRIKNEFLTNMSHAIRIPLNAIIGFSDMLSEDNLNEQQKEQLKMIRDSGNQLLQLVNDIIDFSKIETGKLNVKVTRCDIKSVLDTVDSLIRPAAQEKDLNFEIVRNEPLPLTISTDPARLKQCLLNLVSNAVKFTEQGHVMIKVSWEKEHPEPFIKFEIEDTGVGIQQGKLDVIFKPFYHTDSHTIRKFGGTGLGLAITHHLAELLGGRISVTSILNEGSVFTLCIPTQLAQSAMEKKDTLTPSAAEAQKKQKPGSTAAEKSEDQTKEGKPAQRDTTPHDITEVKLQGRVLIAEDSPTNQALARLLLKKMNLETVIVENGKLAVDKAMNEEFDVVLMDIQMPVMNGYEATKTMIEKGFKKPIIALTACAMKGDEEKCFEAGCSDYLSKPIDRKKLVETLSKYLSVTGNDRQETEAQVKETNMENSTPQQNDQADSQELEMDWNLLMDRIGCEELIDEIIPIFMKDNTERMQKLEEAVEKNDIGEVKFYAHSLKGAAGTVGAAKLSELGRNLEDDARNSDDSRFKPLCQEMRQRFDRLVEFLNKSDWKEIAKAASSQTQAGRS
ncbi:MAG: response regulator [Sedimentisphaerales bacterium]|nr:response regulator [Sedimentisphaerales bacterium]